MRKVTKKRTARAASSASSSSEDDKSEFETKVSNGAGKKDGANDLEDQKSQKNGDGKKSTSHKSNSKSSIGDGKKNRKRSSKDASDESSDFSDEEALSKFAKVAKKTDTSSSKAKVSKPAKEKTQKIQEKTSIEDEVPAPENEDAEYEVEQIVSHKKSHGKMLYLIRWKEFGPDDDTWENATTLDNCPDILKKYTDANPDSILTTSTTKVPEKISKKEKRDKKLKKLKEIVAEKFDENADYEVEKIIDVFFKKDKSREFLVRWKGYRSEYDTWEPEENLSCPDLIEKFMAKVEHAKNLSEKELRPNRKHTERFTLRTQSSVRRLSKRHDGKQRAVYYDAEE